MHPIKASTSRPQPGRIIGRERLWRKLKKLAGEAGTIWISSPPGAGKTTLLSSYIEQNTTPYLWLRLDNAERDPATLFQALGQALKPLQHRAKLPLYKAEYHEGIAEFGRHFMQSLCYQLPSDCQIVLDDLHVLEDSPATLALIDGLLEARTKEQNLFLLSRSAPPASLSRQLLHREMAHLSWESLRLNLDEFTELARTESEHTLDGRQIEQLYSVADGWIAGSLLILKYEGQHGSSLPPGCEHTELLNYFIHEIRHQLDPAEWQFLLESALLPTLTPATATALTGYRQAQRLLDALHHRHLFTERLEGGRQFRYHPLFRKFLLHEGTRTMVETERSKLSERAAELLLNDGDLDGAIELLRGVGAHERLAELVCQHAEAVIEQGRYTSLALWLEAIPDQFDHSNCWLSYWRGISRLATAPCMARDQLQRAFDAFNSDANPHGALLTWCAMVESYLHQWDDFAGLDPWLACYEQLIEQLPTLRHIKARGRAKAMMFAALVFRAPHDPRLPLLAGQLQQLIRLPLNQELRLHVGASLVHYYLWSGESARAAIIIERLRPPKREGATTPLAHITWYQMEAYYLWFTQPHPTSINAVEQGLAVAERSGIHMLDLALAAHGVYGALGSDDLLVAQKYLSVMRQWLRPQRRLDHAHYHYLAGWEALCRDDNTLALEHARSCHQYATDAQAPYPLAMGDAILAQTLLATDAPQQAEEHLERAITFFRAMPSANMLYYCLLSRAWFALNRKDIKQLNETLAEAFALGREKCFENLLWWRQDQLALLCHHALCHNIEVGFVRRHIQQRRLQPPAAARGDSAWPWPIIIHTFGKFQVLQKDEPLLFSSKAQRRPLNLLKCLISFGGREVNRERIIDTLWPDSDGDAALTSFNTTLHRLRRLLGAKEALLFNDGRLSLNPDLCWLDSWAFELLSDEITQRLHDTPTPEITGKLEKRLFTLYRAPFLAEENDAPALVRRERLRERLLRLQESLGKYWEQQGDWAQAEACYHRAIEADEIAERFYQLLMNCYLHQGRRAEAIGIYRNCVQVLDALLGVPPSPQTELIYKSITTTSL